MYGAETLSRRQFVLVDDTAETIAAQNTSITACRHRRSRPSWRRWRKRQRSMWPVPVVMVHEDNEDPLEVRLVQNQQPVPGELLNS